MSSKTIALIVMTACLTLAAMAGAVGPENRAAQDLQAAAPRNEVSVVLKLVQVFVVDRYGRPITDLSLSDFELLDNGRPQFITAFEAHSIALPGRPAGYAPDAAAAAPAKPAAVQGRKFYFVFDYFMNDPGGIRKAKEAAIHFIDNRLAAGDQAGVLALSTDKGLRVLRELTTDRDSARQTVREMVDVTRLRDADATFVPVPSADEDEYDETGAENEAKLEECFRYVRELEDLAKALKAVEGLKNIVFFSRGLALGALLQGGRKLLDSGTGTFVLDSYNAMLEEISRSGSPVYAVNTEGHRRLPPPGSNAYYNSLAGGADALVGLADASGGTYFPTAAHIPELTRQISETTAHYYVLGYPIGVTWEGRYHELSVRVKRPGCSVRAQGGYFDPKSFADLSPLEKDIQLMDAVLGKASPFLAPSAIPLQALPFSAVPEPGGANCFLMAELPRPVGGSAGGSKSELAFFVFDGKGGLVLSRKSEADLSGLRDPAVYAYSPVALAPGSYEARFALRDPDSGRTSVGAAAFSVPTAMEDGPGLREEAGLRLEPPLLLRIGRQAAFLKAAAKENEAGLPSLDAVYPFVTVKTAPLVGDLEAGAVPFAAAVRVRTTEGVEPPDLEWTARFVRLETGRERAAEVREVASQEAHGALAFLLEIERPDLEPGEYTLELRAADRNSDRRALTGARVRVR
jgi:VWFA-related protein